MSQIEIPLLLYGKMRQAAFSRLVVSYAHNAKTLQPRSQGFRVGEDPGNEVVHPRALRLVIRLVVC